MSEKLPNPGESSNESADLALELAKSKEREQVLAEENAQLKEKLRLLEEMSTKDPLTGVENRRGLEDKFRGMSSHFVAGAERREDDKDKDVTLCVVDIDNLKEMNTGFGHPVGDVVIKAVAKKLMEIVRAGDIVARIGGDEFVVVFDDVDEKTLLEKKFSKDGHPAQLSIDSVVIEGKEVPVTVSVGAASLKKGADHADVYNRAYQEADRAVYAAKSAGRNQVVGFSETPPQE